MTEFQQRFLECLARYPNGQASTTQLANRLCTSRVAVVSAGRALERAGRVLAYRSDDSRWASLNWAILRGR